MDKMGEVLKNPWVWGAGALIVLIGLTRSTTSSTTGGDVVAASASTAIAAQQVASSNAALQAQTTQLNNALMISKSFFINFPACNRP